MKNIKKLYIFRHGETHWNREERFQGHTDIPLNDQGRQQAYELARQLQPLGLQALLSSDLQRARETAEIVSKLLQIPIFTDKNLREANLGRAEGKTRREIEAEFGTELVTAWKNWSPHLARQLASQVVSDADVKYPEGETGREVLSRVNAALESFCANQPFHTIGVATHGGVIRRLMQSLRPPGSEPVPIPNGVCYLLLFNPDTELGSPARWSTGSLKA